MWGISKSGNFQNGESLKAGIFKILFFIFYFFDDDNPLFIMISKNIYKNYKIIKKIEKYIKMSNKNLRKTNGTRESSKT